MSPGKTWLTGFFLLAIGGSIGTMGQSDQEVYDVIVIGAGLAGLSAANRILDQNPSTSLLVLEARNVSGGRVMSHRMNTPEGPKSIDIGSQFVSLKHRGILDLALQFGLTVEEQPLCGERTVIQGTPQSTVTSAFRRRKRSYTWTSNLGGSPTIDTVLASSDLDLLASQSCAKFIQTNNLDKSDGDGMKRLLQTFYDAPDTAVSPLQLLLTASSEDGTVDDVLAEMGHGAGLRVKEGLAALIDKLSTRNGLQTLYNSPVTAITQVNPSLQSVTVNGKELMARQVIIAVPPAVASNIDLSPVLPEKMTNFLRNYRPRGFATYFAMTYAKPFWRENGNSGQ
ncbi:unnamed protein product, partial [Mesorhabditis belari]|uniref:Amine oxidase n=1 Tax=Mesorhabditis belari TaxID=2138241 RepID=A0AAF3J854_9BILA